MRPFRRFTALAALAAVLVSALGPWFCRAAMAGEPAPSPASSANASARHSCCGTEGCLPRPASPTDDGAPAAPECPLHALSDSHALMAKAPQAPPAPQILPAPWLASEFGCAPDPTACSLAASLAARSATPPAFPDSFATLQLLTLQQRC